MGTSGPHARSTDAQDGAPAIALADVTAENAAIVRISVPDGTFRVTPGIIKWAMRTTAVSKIDPPTLWQFPDEDERIFREAEALRKLTPRERFLRMLNLMRLTRSMRAANPPTAAARLVRQQEEDEWREAFRKLYEQHGSDSDSRAGTD